ncbi:helix-turn-helix domain-containing protein [Streptomyces sp. NPDC059009]|uniref:helix-turn-helix domain-containing protein n=1 Tax=Streptomyces sp. NPDC059009 TaxID=3346694 RepID=UPI00368B082D
MDRIRGRLKSRRHIAGLTCSEVARRVGVHEATVYKWEAGDRTPDALNLARWAHAVRAGHRGLLVLAEDDTAVWASLVAGEYLRQERDRTGTIRNSKQAHATLISDRCRKVAAISF